MVTRLIGVLVLTALPVGAFAQEFTEPAGGYNPDMFSIMSRIRDPVVRDILELRDDQLERIRECHNAWVAEFNGFQMMPSEDRDLDQQGEALRAHEARLVSLLSDEQAARLVQLTQASWISYRLLERMREPMLRDELNLTAEQRGHIEGQYKDWLLSSEEYFLAIADQEPDGRLRAFHVANFNDNREAEIRRSLVDLLTDQQRERLDQTELQWRVLSVGGGIFLDESVQNDLELDEAQIEQISSLIPPESRPNSRQFDLIEESYMKCMKQLTDAQMTRWKEMLGKQYGAVDWIIPQ